jgi:hypothetical protein
MMKRTMLIAVVCVFIAAPTFADYGTVNLKEVSTAPGLGGFTLTAHNFTSGVGGVLAGQYNFDINGGAGITVPGITSYTQLPEWGFCIEMQYSTSGYQTYNIKDLQDAPLTGGIGGLPMGSTKADFIRELWANHIADTQVGGAAGNTNAAAFQLAVWEIVYEDNGSWDVTATSGAADTGFKASGNAGALNLANTWLGELDGQGMAGGLYAYSNNTYQDYVFQVPVPAAVLLGLLGLGAAGVRLRRFA